MMAKGSTTHAEEVSWQSYFLQTENKTVARGRQKPCIMFSCKMHSTSEARIHNEFHQCFKQHQFVMHLCLGSTLGKKESRISTAHSNFPSPPTPSTKLFSQCSTIKLQKAGIRLTCDTSACNEANQLPPSCTIGTPTNFQPAIWTRTNIYSL